MDAAKFTSLPQLNEGAEARVYHDEEGKVGLQTFQGPGRQSRRFVPGQMRMGGDGQIRIAAGPRPTFLELLGRMARTNAAGNLTPHGIRGGYAGRIFRFRTAFRYGAGRQRKECSFCSRFVGLRIITQMGGTAAVGKVDDKLVIFDDLHGRNVKVAPNGRVEVIDAINRELTSREAKKLREWRKLPAEFRK